jgi:sugar phosphate isomerase/epimerase
MRVTRRSFMQLPAALAVGGRSRFKIGVPDWNLGLSGKVEAVALAKELGFEGIELSLGERPVAGRLRLAEGELQQRYRAAAKEHGLALISTCLDILTADPFQSGPLGRRWVADGIRATSALGAPVMLLPFFEKGVLVTRADQEHVGDLLREFAPQAAEVVLGLEDTLSAEDNARIMERARSNAVKVFYDTGNALEAGFDPVREIRWLGKDRICGIHLKDQGYLGEGKVDFPGVLKALVDIGYEGFADLETESPSKSIAADLRRNLAFIRKLMP